MSKSILPCRKATNGVYASRYLNRAERLAKSIKSKYGKKTNIIDGCIVQGAKANKTISASSIELPSGVLSSLTCILPSNDIVHGGIAGHFTVPNRDPFHPLQASKKGADFSKYPHEDPLYSKRARFGHSDFGTYLVYKAKYHITPSIKTHAGRFYLYSPAYTRLGFDQNQHYISVFMTPMVNGLPGVHVSFHDDYIKAATGGYSIGSEMSLQNMSSELVEVGYGVFAVVFAVSKEIYQQADPDTPGYYQHAKYKTRLLLAVVDLRLEESKGDADLDAKADFFLFPEELIPENMRPMSVMVNGDNNTVLSVPAPSVMTIQDLGLDENGNILAAIKYQVKVQSNDRGYVYQGGGVSRMFKGHEGTGVMAFGLASWGRQGSYFNVHSLEVVEGSGDDELVRRFGVSPSEAMFGDRQVLIGGDVYRWGIPVSRRTAAVFAVASVTDYQMLPPYVVELKNGVPTGNNALNGPTDLLSVRKELFFGYGASIDFERDFQLNNDWIRGSLSGEKALVSDSCYAIPAGENIETTTSTWLGYTIGFTATSAGIMFMDGDRRKFESISELSGAHESYGMTVSCHQREVRDENGKLVMPSALIVCAYKGDRPKMFIRKGPIWPEDFAEDEDPSDYSGLWVEAEANIANINDKHYAKIVYVGNQLMANKHGEVFQ